MQEASRHIVIITEHIGERGNHSFVPKPVHSHPTGKHSCLPEHSDHRVSSCCNRLHFSQFLTTKGLCWCTLIILIISIINNNTTATHKNKIIIYNNNTVTCPLADSYVTRAACEAGSAAELAASRKEEKYAAMDCRYIFAARCYA